jgi:hypothetical protein
VLRQRVATAGWPNAHLSPKNLPLSSTLVSTTVPLTQEVPKPTLHALLINGPVLEGRKPIEGTGRVGVYRYGTGP